MATTVKAKSEENAVNKLTILGISFFPLWDMGDKKGKPSIYHVQKAFADKGHNVHFLFPSDKNLNREYEGIHIHEFRMTADNWLPKQLPKGLGFVYQKAISIIFALKATKHAIQVSAASRPDVIYAHDYLSVPAVFLLSKLYRAKNVTRLYGTFLYPCISRPFQFLLRLDEAIGFKIPATYLIITNDGTNGDIVAARLGVPSERIKFWMNGVDTSICNPNFDASEFRRAMGISANAKVVLSVTRLVKWKRIDSLIGAVPRIVSKNRDVVFFIVGDGPERKSLERMSEELGVNGYVRFTGAITHTEVSEFLNAADVFIALDERSNLANPVLEAMVCGKCIVALNAGGTSEIIEHKSNGILLDHPNLKDLAEVLNYVVENQELRIMLGRNAKDYAMAHLLTWDQRAEMEVELVEDAARRKKTPGSKRARRL